MGKLSDCVQTVQLVEGRQNPERSKYASAIERAALNYLSEIYISHDVEIRSGEQLESWGIDCDVFDLIFNGWEKVVVGADGTVVYFRES